MSKHTIPKDVQEHLEALLNMAVQVAELQYDDTAREGIYVLVESIADEFDIAKLYIETEEDIDSEGNTTITVKSVEVDLSEDDDPPDTIH